MIKVPNNLEGKVLSFVRQNDRDKVCRAGILVTGQEVTGSVKKRKMVPLEGLHTLTRYS